ncbi:MAG: hypothetical protein JRI91_12320 [Deltaproteobacteria bacterium]|nr:hypothetical protein [Deltaproteobacteria bacterium]
MKVEDQQTISLFVQEVLNTKESRHLLSLIAPELVRMWADKNPLKNKISGPLERIIRNGFLPEPEENYSSLLDSAGNIGKLVTIAARMLTKIHESNPDFLARTFEPGFKKFIEGIDFGELRDLMDGSADDIAALVKMANDVAWLYPAKLVLTLSFIPDIVNGMLLIVKESVNRFNQTSPDIVADIVLSLVRKIDGRSAGKCFNELIELIRSIHTGSALIGDPGTPKFLQDISKLFTDAAEFVDGEVLAKARVALSEDREAICNTTTDVLKENPDLWLKPLMRYADIINPGIRSKSYRLSALEELPEEDLTIAVNNGISDLDMQEAAEVINLFSTLFNRVRSLKPAILETLVTQFVNALDLYEVKDAAGRMMTDLGESFRPAGRAIIPHVVKAVCRIVEPADDEYEDDMAEAREMLRAVLVGEEASS